jgi:oligoribonuclease NrnB/cAMP/cGMP phosphodiesterase (DHH superfamily)
VPGYPPLMRRVCFHHAGCPDGFGAAWAVREAWGDAAEYRPRGHDDSLDAAELAGAEICFVDIAPPNNGLRALMAAARRVVVLDHHVTSRDRYEADTALKDAVAESPHTVHFELEHSGAVLAWRHFHPERPTPDLIAYVEDQDLWNWKLPRSREVNATVASHPLEFGAWDHLAATPWEQLAEDGVPIVRAQQAEIERSLRNAHSVWLGEHRLEAVNALFQRALIGHELATRAAHGVPCGLVYRVAGERVDVSIYSIGDFDVATLAANQGGGGHRHAAGFSVPLERWLAEFL